MGREFPNVSGCQTNRNVLGLYSSVFGGSEGVASLESA